MTTTRPGNERATVTVTYPSPSEIRVERSFDAPRRMVWDAHTKPELIKQWQLGPDGWTMPNCRFDAREGGSYRFEWLRRPPANGWRWAAASSSTLRSSAWSRRSSSTRPGTRASA